MRPYLMLFIIFLMIEVSLLLQVPCIVTLEQGVQYHRITWYKVSFRSDILVGLVMKDIRTNKTQLYKFANYSYQIGDDLSLHVPGHSPKECVLYRCSVWPPVGHRMLQSDYSLPQGCNTTVKTETSTHSQDSQMVIFKQSISGAVLVSSIGAMAVCLCKWRKTCNKIPLSVGI